MTKKLRVGDEIEGFFGGYFGRDSYGWKEVVATGKFKGDRWAVFYVTDYGESSYFYVLNGFSLSQVEAEADGQDKDTKGTRP